MSSSMPENSHIKKFIQKAEWAGDFSMDNIINAWIIHGKCVYEYFLICYNCCFMFTITFSKKEQKCFTKHFRAFSLQELLVVLAIIGILTLIALPNLMPLISRAKSAEAQQQLAFLHSLQQTYYYSHSKYSNSLEELGYEQVRTVNEGGTANYLIEIVEASETGFKAKATAVVDFDGDGMLSVWEIDEKKTLTEVTKD